MGASEYDRFNDLQRQGFMKPRKSRKVRVKGPTVACNACQNWHEKGKHTKKLTTAEKRRAVQRLVGAPLDLTPSYGRPPAVGMDGIRIGTSENLRSRIAHALGWSEADVRSFSLQALRDLVRPVDAGLAREIEERVSSGRILL